MQKLAGENFESFDISLFEIANAYYNKDKKSKNGISIGCISDQNMGDKNTIFTPLFGIQISTITATYHLSKGGNTAVIPYSFIRVDNKYHISFSVPLENYPNGDLVEDTKRTNKILAEQIKKTFIVPMDS